MYICLEIRARSCTVIAFFRTVRTTRSLKQSTSGWIILLLLRTSFVCGTSAESLSFEQCCLFQWPLLFLLLLDNFYAVLELSETGRKLGPFFAALNDDFSTKDSRTEPKLAWLESSCHEDSKYVDKFFVLFCEWNSSTKCIATPFSAARGPIRGGETVAHMWPPVAEIAAL